MSTVTAQVIAAGISYFTAEKVLGPDGEQMLDPINNQPIITRLRHNSPMGSVVELTEHEFNRLSALGAVRSPQEGPIQPKIPAPTPFGVPMPNEEGDMVAFQGPIMGDPAPTAGLSDIELRDAAGALTPEALAAIQEQAVTGATEQSSEAIADRDYEAAQKSALEAEIARRNEGRDEEDLIEVEGSGSNGNIIKDDLILALEEDDEANV